MKRSLHKGTSEEETSGKLSISMKEGAPWLQQPQTRTTKATLKFLMDIKRVDVSALRKQSRIKSWLSITTYG